MSKVHKVPSYSRYFPHYSSHVWPFIRLYQIFRSFRWLRVKLFWCNHTYVAYLWSIPQILFVCPLQLWFLFPKSILFMQGQKDNCWQALQTSIFSQEVAISLFTLHPGISSYENNTKPSERCPSRGFRTNSNLSTLGNILPIIPL